MSNQFLSKNESFKKGDIAIVPFPFTDLSGQKIRPVVILSMSNNSDITVCFISSNTTTINSDEIQIHPDKINNLKIESKIVCSKITTLDRKIFLGKIGSLDKEKLNLVNEKLKLFFGL